MTDDELLARLGAALHDHASPVEPPAASITAFRTVLAAGSPAAGVANVGAGRRSLHGAERARRTRRRVGSPGASALAAGRVLLGRPLAAAGLAVAVVVGGSGVALASAGAPLPRPIREVVSAVGLPVDNVDLSDAKSARDALAQAIRRRDASEAAAEAQRLHRILAVMSAKERSKLGPRTTQLLAEAQVFAAANPELGRAAQGASTTKPGKASTSTSTSSTSTSSSPTSSSTTSSTSTSTTSTSTTSTTSTTTGTRQPGPPSTAPGSPPVSPPGSHGAPTTTHPPTSGPAPTTQPPSTSPPATSPPATSPPATGPSRTTAPPRSSPPGATAPLRASELRGNAGSARQS